VTETEASVEKEQLDDRATPIERTYACSSARSAPRIETFDAIDVAAAVDVAADVAAVHVAGWSFLSVF